jgi:hypothetical protein
MNETEREWTTIEVDALPYPHNLFRCRWKQEWKAAWHELGEPEDQPGLRRVFERFVDRVGGARVRQCPYHEPDWPRVAELGVKLTASGHKPADAELFAMVDGLGRDEAWALMALFDEPMFLNGEQLGAGQHRSCAMRLTGASRCPIAR